MTGRASNQRGIRLAQIALSAYFDDRQGLRRGESDAAKREWSEDDIVDLMSDLLLLSREKKYDLRTILSKIAAHIEAETGRSVDHRAVQKPFANGALPVGTSAAAPAISGEGRRRR